MDLRIYPVDRIGVSAVIQDAPCPQISYVRVTQRTFPVIRSFEAVDLKKI